MIVNTNNIPVMMVTSSETSLSAVDTMPWAMVAAPASVPKYAASS